MKHGQDVRAKGQEGEEGGRGEGGGGGGDHVGIMHLLKLNLCVGQCGDLGFINLPLCFSIPWA